MKRTIWFCALLCLCAGLAFPVDFTALQPQGYVSDFAHVMDDSGRASLEQYCLRLERATGAQIAIVTLPSLQGEPVEDVANALYRKWGIGQKGKDEGALLLLSIQDRRSRLETGYGLEPIIPDGFAGSVLRAMRPYLRQGQYSAALQEGAATIGTRIAQAKGVSLDPPAGHQRQRRKERPIPLMVIFGGLIAFVVLSSLLGRGGGGPSGRSYGYRGGGFLPGLLLGNLLGSSIGHGGGRGGFGGFDSSDGFGGFGGGDSGGGGASSSW